MRVVLPRQTWYSTCVTDPCSFIAHIGCCMDGPLYYCDGGQPTITDCGGICGWDQANGWYECGFSGADPSGQHPIDCGV